MVSCATGGTGLVCVSKSRPSHHEAGVGKFLKDSARRSKEQWPRPEETNAEAALWLGKSPNLGADSSLSLLNLLFPPHRAGALSRKKITQLIENVLQSIWDNTKDNSKITPPLPPPPDHPI